MRAVDDERQERERDEHRGPDVVAVQEERAQKERRKTERETGAQPNRVARAEALQHQDAHGRRRGRAHRHQYLEDEDVVVL